jgi:hypothetical protein
MSRHPALRLALLVAVFYTVVGNLRVASGDGETMFQVTRALLEQGRIDLPPDALAPVEVVPAHSSDTQISYTAVGRDGRTYSKYGFGQSLAAAPLYLAGMIWRALTGILHAPRDAALLLNGFLTAGTAGLLFLLTRRLGFPGKVATVLALAFAFCTPAWAYTHTFFSEPLVTFCLVGAALSSVRFTQTEQTRWLALVGGALALAMLTRINAVAALPAFGLYLVLTWRARRVSFRVIVCQAAILMSAMGIGIGLMLWYNVSRFGAPFDFGYRTANWQTPFLVGLYGLTLSPGKGLLWYAPPVLLGLIGLPAFARRLPREAVLCVGVLVGYLLVHGTYTYWEGGWCWGPRLVLPALPFALLPAASLLVRKRRSQAMELGLALVFVFGLLVQIPAVGSSYEHALQRVYGASPAHFQDRVLFSPAHSPLLGQWVSLLQVTANLRSASARAQIAELLSQVHPAETSVLTDTRSETVRLERQHILSLNLPDLWLVSRPWLRLEIETQSESLNP